MNDFDQAARFAAQADESAVRRVLEPTGVELPFLGWLDTRTVPPPGGPDRTADLAAALVRPGGGGPVLLVLEFQSSHDPLKLDVSLEEAATHRVRTRHGPDREGRYDVLIALVYLTGECPNKVLDMTLGGYGTLHRPLVWEVAKDDARDTLERVARGELSWGMLFWVPLMAGGDDAAVAALWREVVTAKVPDRNRRDDLIVVAGEFAELARRTLAWEQALGGFEMGESQFCNGLRAEGEARGALRDRRQLLIRLVDNRFPGAMSDDVRRLISEQESMELLAHWFDAAASEQTYQQLLDVLKQ